jgi:dinuclear metal center YbgI/SA1388 family protein
MTQTVRSVLADLATLAPPSKAAGWDPVGLQVGDAASTVRVAAVCHEVTDDVVAVLDRDPVDLLVVYHPLLFRPVTRFVSGATAAGRAWRLATAGVAVATVHTAFDVTAGGTAVALADTLGLSSVSSFGPAWGPDAVKIVTFVPAASVVAVEEAMAAAGAGLIGNYSRCAFRAAGDGVFLPGEGTDPTVGSSSALNVEPEVRIEMLAPAERRDRVVTALVAAHPYEEPVFDVYPAASSAGFVGRAGVLESAIPLRDFAAAVGVSLSATVRYSGDGASTVSKVAVVPGSGSSFIDHAAGAAEVLVTGDITHHQARKATDRGLAVVDAGHVPTERPGVARLYAAVSAIIPGAVDLTHLDPEPWKEP